MSRLETGHHAPPVELARAIYRFYSGELDIVDLYDPTFMDEVGIIQESGNAWFTVTTRTTEHKAHGQGPLRALLHYLATGESIPER